MPLSVHPYRRKPAQGVDLINEVVGQFATQVARLETGISQVMAERSAKADEIARRQKEFEAFRDTTVQQIADLSTAVADAQAVKNNIAALLNR
jgi:hypothetical protein